MSLNIYNRNFTILTVFLVLQFISNGSSIKCFVCDSSNNPSCTDLKSNSSIVAEECTLDKVRSGDTWLLELNKFAFFNTGLHKSPLMNCQKVIARDPNTNKMVTARFCQLDTAETDACVILRNKLHPPSNNDAAIEQNNNNINVNNGRHMMQQQTEAEKKEFHCSICTSDNCNGATSHHSTMTMTLVGGGALLTALMIVPRQQLIFRLW